MKRTFIYTIVESREFEVEVEAEGNDLVDCENEALIQVREQIANIKFDPYDGKQAEEYTIKSFKIIK